MTAQPSWTILAVRHDTRDAVAKAAADSGMPLSDWVDRRLQAATDDTRAPTASSIQRTVIWLVIYKSIVFFLILSLMFSDDLLTALIFVFRYIHYAFVTIASFVLSWYTYLYGLVSDDMRLNLLSEAVGIIFTVLVIDRLYQFRQAAAAHRYTKELSFVIENEIPNAVREISLLRNFDLCSLERLKNFIWYIDNARKYLNRVERKIDNLGHLMASNIVSEVDTMLIGYDNTLREVEGHASMCYAWSQGFASRIADKDEHMRLGRLGYKHSYDQFDGVYSESDDQNADYTFNRQLHSNAIEKLLDTLTESMRADQARIVGLVGTKPTFY